MNNKISFLRACKTNNEKNIWETFEYVRQTNNLAFEMGIKAAVIFCQSLSLKTLACLVRDADFQNDEFNSDISEIFLDYYDENTERLHRHTIIKQFCYNFIPLLAKTTYLHETPWFRIMIMYVFEQKKLDNLIVHLFPSYSEGS